jgi:UDP-N-acetylmuramoyl-tripeptide--D-alanyl-D-alanine ligase
MHTIVSTEHLYEHFLLSGQKVCTDTRKPKAGSLFFALKGGNFNANAFAHQAIEAGCRLAIVDEAIYANQKNIVLVTNVLETLQSLANFHRRQLSIPFLAITGSNAKTTHKELIKAVLSKKFRTCATVGNLNNHIGVPLTVLSVTKDDEFAIIEMGANHQGEIKSLCDIAEPDYGLITNIGKAHLEGFGGIEGVKLGKSELYRFLSSRQGKIFINGDDDVLNALAAENDKVTYGCKKLYDTIGKNYQNNETVSFKYTTRYGEKDWSKIEPINTKITGAYNFVNCLAAACVGNYFKVDEHLIKEALESYVPDMNRSQLVDTGKNILLLDAYNANPNSMKVAVENFSAYKAEHKLLLLGDMFELGEFSREEHQKLIDLLLEYKFDNVILVGEAFFNSENNNYLKFKTTAECRNYLTNKRFVGNTVLIKGSRSMAMETLQEAL